MARAGSCSLVCFEQAVGPGSHDRFANTCRATRRTKCLAKRVPYTLARAGLEATPSRTCRPSASCRLSVRGWLSTQKVRASEVDRTRTRKQRAPPSSGKMQIRRFGPIQTPPSVKCATPHICGFLAGVRSLTAGSDRLPVYPAIARGGDGSRRAVIRPAVPILPQTLGETGPS